MIRGAELDAHKRGVTPTQREFDGYAHRRGRAAAVWRSAVGFRLSRPLRRVLARARQPLLGRHLRGDRLPAAARGFAAQGWFRMVGTVVGGRSVVVLTACVPQD